MLSQQIPDENQTKALTQITQKKKQQTIKKYQVNDKKEIKNESRH